MKTLHKYLTRQVLAALLLTVSVFTFVLLIGNVLQDILAIVITGNAQPGPMLEAIGLLIPFVWVFALPMGMLTATLLVFGRFSADQELTAARASGISLFSLITPVLLLSLLCCALSAWINMSFGPQCRVAYKNLIFSMKAELVNMQLPEGRYVRDFPGYIFYIEKNDGGQLENVKIFMLQNETNVNMFVSAPRGEVQINTTNKSLALHLFNPRIIQLIRQNGDNGQKALITGVSDTIVNISPNTSTNKSVAPKISDMTFWELRQELKNIEASVGLPPDSAATPDKLRDQLRQLKKSKNDLVEPVRVALHRQLAFSFACFGFTLVGIPLGIRVHRRETNVGVAIALGLVLVYYSFVLVAQSLSGHPEFAPHLILWLPNFVFQAVGAVLLWRANRGI